MKWSRQRFKKRAKRVFFNNYGYAVAVCFLIAFIAGESSNSVRIITQYDHTKQEASHTAYTITNYSNREAIIDWMNDLDLFEEADQYVGDQSESIYTFIVENIVSDNTILFRIYEANKTFIINNKIYVGIAIGVGSALITIFGIFISNILKVGKRRFFLENRIVKDTKTPIGTIMYAFKKGLYFKILKIMFFRYLYTLLWMLTIVGGVIKFYEYRAIPYILAGNSQLTTKEVFALSKSMMKGYKWKYFVLDISFLPWNILESLTLGVAGLFFVVPYAAATQAEAYMFVRNTAIALKKPHYEFLNNPLFNENIEEYLYTDNF